MENPGLHVPLSPPESLATALSEGQVVILVDHLDRENEGDFVLAAERATVAQMAFMLSHANGGLLFLAIAGHRLDELEIPLMCERNTERNRTQFTVSVDAAEGQILRRDRLWLPKRERKRSSRGYTMQ